MIYGLYLSTSGALMQSSRTEAISNNLANANTPGFKKDLKVMQRFPTQAERKNINPFRLNPLAEQLGGTVMLNGSYSIHEGGALKQTGNPLDFAIRSEKGMFELQNDNGDTFYTRAGSFAIGRDGVLRTHDGKYALSSTNGQPIPVQGSDVVINDGGQVIVDGEPVAQMRIVDFEEYRNLRKVGDNLFVDNGAGVLEDQPFTVQSGVVETSNVNTVREMVKLIEAQRMYEANMKMIQSQDETLRRAVQDVGRTPA